MVAKRRGVSGKARRQANPHRAWPTDATQPETPRRASPFPSNSFRTAWGGGPGAMARLRCQRQTGHFASAIWKISFGICSRSRLLAREKSDSTPVPGVVPGVHAGHHRGLPQTQRRGRVRQSILLIAKTTAAMSPASSRSGPARVTFENRSKYCAGPRKEPDSNDDLRCQRGSHQRHAHACGWATSRALFRE